MRLWLITIHHCAGLWMLAQPHAGPAYLPFRSCRTKCGDLLMKPTVLLILVCSLLPLTAFCQSGFFSNWEDRVRATSSKQPAWPVPVIGSASTIVQLARTDFVRQYTSTHTL